MAPVRCSRLHATFLALACAVALPALAQAPAAAAPAARRAPGIEPMVATVEKQAATEFAMVVVLTRAVVARQCQKLPDPTRGRAASALASWRARNRPAVEFLPSWVNYMAGIDATSKPQYEQALRNYMMGYKAKAAVFARVELGTDKPDAAACNLALARFEDPSRDLARSKHGPELQAIRVYMQRLTQGQAPASR